MRSCPRLIGSRERTIAPPTRARWRAAVATIGAAALCSGSTLGCGALTGKQEPRLDSNTNWLRSCGPDLPCGGALVCLCGMCSQPCAGDSECSLLPGASCASARCGAPAAGGMCVVTCTTQAECGAGATCTEGTCVPLPAQPLLEDGRTAAAAPEASATPGCGTGVLTVDALFALIDADLAGLPREAQPFARYLTLSPQHNAGECESMQSYRDGVDVALNSTSLQPNVTRAVSVDPRELVLRVDLRDYGWLQPLQVGGAMYPSAWEAVIDRTGPTAVEFSGPEADRVKMRTQTRVPLAPGVSLAVALLQPELYYALTARAATLPDWLAAVGVDVNQNRESGAARRAGTDASEVSVTQRAIERHPLPNATQGLWLALGLRPEQDLFVDPLLSDGAETFLLAPLPNGLPQFALFDAGGQRSARSLWAIDRISSADLVPEVARSCTGCHPTGPAPVEDRVRDFVTRNADSYPQSVIADVERLYASAGELLALSDADNAEYAAAFSFSLSASPWQNLAIRTLNDVAPEQALSELWSSPLALMSGRTAVDPELRRSTGRSAFLDAYAANLCALHDGSRNRPKGCASP